VQASILVVDDEAGPRESLRMILKDEYKVRLASSGPEALDMIKQQRPDLVFLDIRMPQMDGTEALRQIKQIAPEVEVAMITAYAAVTSAQRAMRFGALDYLTKPFGVAEVEAVVERALAKRRRQSEEQLLLHQLSETITQLSQELAQARTHEVAADDSAVLRGLTSAHSSIENHLNEVLHLSSVGEVAAEVAHDLNNFLSTILFRIELMLLNLGQPEGTDLGTLEQGLQEIAMAAYDGGEALKRISLLAPSSPYEPDQQVDVNEILGDAAKMAQGRVDNHEQHLFIWELGELPTVQGSPPGLRTVFTNLMINAHQAMPDQGEIRVRTFADDAHVVAQIADTGVGMSSEVLERLAEPFFTTKGERGTGLGLTVTHKVIEQHSGTIKFDSRPGEGTTITVRLPVTQSPQPVEPDQATILVVDDQKGMLSVTIEALLAHGFHAIPAASASEVLSIMRERLTAAQPAPAVVITDLRMPDMLGTDLAAQIKDMAPDTRIMLLSAYLGESDASNRPDIDVAVSKPFGLRELARLVEELLQAQA